MEVPGLRVWLGNEAKAATVEAVTHGHRLEWTMHLDEKQNWCFDLAPVKHVRIAEER